MKLTKLMVLALVLALFVCAFVACGGTTDTETQAPETQAPETQAPDSETEAPGEDTEAECAHEIVVDEKAATCSDRGYKKETCKLCGEVVSETAYPKTAHTASGAATCDTDSKCTVCGEVLEAAKGHVWGEVTTTAATCTAAGKETKTCTVCNTTDVKELATLAHDIAEATEYVPATCTTEGSKTGVCSLCGQTQTVVLPAAHVVTDLGDLSALTFVDGKIQAKCTACEAVVDVTAEVRFALSFDEADVATELAKYGEDFKYVIVYNADQAGTATGDRVPVVKNYPDAADGHTSVLATIHNSSPAITFKGELLADADYYVISFDWRATKYGNNTNKIGAFGQAAKAFEGVAGEGDMVYAFKVDRSNGDLYDHSGKNKFGSAPAEQWYKVIVVVDNESGTAYTYVDGVCVATTQNAKWQVVEGGEYTWRFGGIYNVFHVPEFDNFEVVAIQKSVTEVGPSVDGGDEEEGDEEDDGTGCAHQCTLEYQLPTPTTPGFIKRTCLICGRVVTFEVLDHQCTPNVPADCVNSSYCTECDKLIEAAWGHVLDENQPITDTLGAIPCVDKGRKDGFCVVCQRPVSVDLDPIAHTFVITSVSDLTFADGVFTAKCSACGQEDVVPTEALMTLDFDKSVAEELAAHETQYGFAASVVWHESKSSGQCDPGVAKLDGRSVLEIAVYGNGTTSNKAQAVKFSGDMLGASSYYVVSFDVSYQANRTDLANDDWRGLFGRMALTSDATPAGKISFDNDKYVVLADRDATPQIANVGKTATKDITVKAWYTVTILVDNNTGDATIYVDGVLLGTSAKNMLVKSGEYYAWIFGGNFNNGHKPYFDNFKVYALDTACLHTNTTAVETAPATCIAPGTANLVCNKCGEVAGTKDIPMLDHVASTNVIEEKSCCTVYACTGAADGCTETVNVAKEGATHAVSAPTTFDANTVVKDGKIQAACADCGLYFDAPITEDIRLALNFDKTDLATEVAALNTANSALGLTITNDTAYETKVYDEGATTALRCISGSPLWITFKSDVLADSSYYMISLDWRFTNATNYNDVNAPFTFYGDTTSAWAANPFKYHRGDKVFLKGNAGTDVVYPTDGSTLNLNEWYHITLVVDNSTGKVYVYINDTYAQTVSTAHVKMVTGGAKYWRFNENSSAHSPEYDNFKVEVLAKTAVTG